jgi:hypothetical protein
MAGASIAFWNKGDVQVLVLDKVNKRNYPLDDRVLNPGEDVSALLSSYSERVLALSKNATESEALKCARASQVWAAVLHSGMADVNRRIHKRAPSIRLFTGR